MDSFSAAYADACFMLIDRFSSPKDKEKRAFTTEASGEIRFIEINNVIFFLLKLGDMPWQDAPFTPHWSDPAPFHLPVPAGNIGYTFHLMLIDSITNQQVKNRLVGAGVAFSNELHSVISENYMKPFDRSKYDYNVQKTYRKYTSSQLAELCPENQRYIIGTTDSQVETEKYIDDSIPSELQKWVCFPGDDSYRLNINCVPKCLLDSGEALDDLIVPLPIDYVLDVGYEVIEGGHICVDIEYDDFFGAVIPPKYE